MFLNIELPKIEESKYKLILEENLLEGAKTS